MMLREFLASTLKQLLLVVVTNEEQANEMADTLKVLVENSKDILFLPDRDALPYERLISDAETTQQRMNALICLAERERNAVIVCSARALTQPVIPPQELLASLYDLKPGQEVDLTLMLEHLYNLGYVPVTELEEARQVNHRGRIVGLFPPTFPRPLRIDFFADEIESLRTHDPQTPPS